MNRITPEHNWRIPRVGTPQVSPDGLRVVFTTTNFDLETDQSRSGLHLLEIGTGQVRRLTAGTRKDGSPAWSTDSRRLAFCSDREGGPPQLHVIDVEGGEARRVTQLPFAVEDPHWIPGQDALVFLGKVPGHCRDVEDAARMLDERSRAPRVQVTENRLYRYWDKWLTDGDFYHIYTLELATGKVTDRTPGMRRFMELMESKGQYDVAPDGSFLVFSANSTEPPYDSIRFALYRLDLATNAIEQITPEDERGYVKPRISPDGRHLVHGMKVNPDFYADRVVLVSHDLLRNERRELTSGWDRSPSDWSFTRNGSCLLVVAEEDQKAPVFRLSIEGGAPVIALTGGTLAGPQEAEDGVMVAQRSSLAKPPEIVVFSSTGRRVYETSFHEEAIEDVTLGAFEEMDFEGAKGHEVKMIVVYPPGFDARAKWPLIQLVHGGPHASYGDNWHFRWNPHLFAAEGFVVAMVNFHGSTGFGQAFTESIRGQQPDMPFEDVMRSTDLLVGKGWIDEERMAAAGASYGGYLTHWIGGHTDRYKALVNHAGVYNLLAQHGTDSLYGRDTSYGGTPWDGLEIIERQSPNRYVTGMKTPTLLLHGGQDFRVPIGHALEAYNVLRAKGVPARLVHFPDENHWILKPRNSLIWHREVLGWIRRWMDPGPSPS